VKTQIKFGELVTETVVLPSSRNDLIIIFMGIPLRFMDEKRRNLKLSLTESLRKIFVLPSWFVRIST
jgi:hypothetical protein